MESRSTVRGRTRGAPATTTEPVPDEPPAHVGLDTSSLSRLPGYIFRRAQLVVTQGVSELLAPYDLRRSSFASLLLIKYNPGSTPSDLADTLGIGRANYVALLEDLHQRELVTREPRADDRRFRSVFLTRKGSRLINKVEPLVNALEERHRRELDVDGVDVLGLVRRWLEAQQPR